MPQYNQIESEEYKGADHLTSAAGNFYIWGLPGSLALGCVLAMRGFRSNMTIAAASLANLGFAFIGAMQGWHKATLGKEQFDAAKNQIRLDGAKIDGLEKQIDGLRTEHEAEKMQFSQQLKSHAGAEHAHGSHASHAHKADGESAANFADEITPRHAHGSHADAHLAAKEQAAEAEPALA